MLRWAFFTLSRILLILEWRNNVALLATYESIMMVSGAFFGGAVGVLGGNVRFGMMAGAAVFIFFGWILAFASMGVFAVYYLTR